MPVEVLATPRERIRDTGQRVTGLRITILEALQDLGHASADQLVQAARERLGSISLQAVYDSLGVLGKAGLLRRIEPAGSPALFELRVQDNHHHLVCRRCGSVADVDCALGHAPCLAPISDFGYQVDEAEVTYWGVCPSCQTDSAASPVLPTDS
ncbi:MAG TPA: Fur family transcriptional regulator [Candidatus Dormibacteraeota bacterium]|nr:Fur family transcriptional regulator [Candidatus Dormibacteraeota bacterium]